MYIYTYWSAAVWLWIGSMRVVCLCVYSFVICWSPLNVSGTYFAFLGATLGLILKAFGASLAPKGFSLASLWLIIYMCTYIYICIRTYVSTTYYVVRST